MAAPEESKHGFDWTTTVYIFLIVVPVFFAISAVGWKLRRLLQARKQKQTDIEMNTRRRNWWQSNGLEDAATADSGSTHAHQDTRAPTTTREEQVRERYWQQFNARQPPVKDQPKKPEPVHTRPESPLEEVNFSRPRPCPTASPTGASARSPTASSFYGETIADTASSFYGGADTTYSVFGDPFALESDTEELVPKDPQEQVVPRRRVKDFDRDLLNRANEALKTDEGARNFKVPGDDANETEKKALFEAILQHKARKAARRAERERRNRRREGDDDAERARRRNRHGSPGSSRRSQQKEKKQSIRKLVGSLFSGESDMR